MARWRGVRGSASDRGAAAVEFALVVPVLFLLVFGILDYGRFFFDSVSLRQGAREAARQAVVQQYPGSVLGSSPTPACSSSLFAVGARIACSAKAASDITIGTPAVNIPTIPAVGTNVAGWHQGNQLLVCMASKELGTGFVPLPGGGMGIGFLRTKVYMSIEVDKPSNGDPTFTETDPTGGTWSWCK